MNYQIESAFNLMNVYKRIPLSGNTMISCPLAPYLHPKGTDKHPSCSVNLDKEVFYCFTCQSKGSIKSLCFLYAQHTGDYRAFEIFKTKSKDPWSFSKSFKDHNHAYKIVGQRMRQALKSIPKTFKEEEIHPFLKEIHPYVFERGLTRSQIFKWEIGYDLNTQRIIFVTRDYQKKIVGISGRSVIETQKPKYKHFSGFSKDKILYGEVHLDRKDKRAYLVEGFLDVLNLDKNQMTNVLATLGASISQDQIDKLKQWFTEIILFPDCDDGGVGLKHCYDTALKLKKENLKVGIAGILKQNTLELIPIECLKGKDPGDLSQDEMNQALKQIFWF